MRMKSLKFIRIFAHIIGLCGICVVENLRRLGLEKAEILDFYAIAVASAGRANSWLNISIFVWMHKFV
jgi:hypothetical protein